ncbi:hypothetical protein S40285_08825 [Stachybotrys chlorohalonatus IBT 40285]|uniref:Uncharacterized protein n=1 Tax=Stachybotrys chlorohalonatus (strain IBT 40285) TaxID=1283841 RepID=A0A084QVQ8_STAC4|nr:hypothetical protein S40285_08825 [Stachybotrys chlorohalonata IBT 40285]
MTSSVAASTAASATATASSFPLTISLRPSIDGASNFSPFRDLTRLTNGNPFSFRNLIIDGIDGGQDVVLFRSGCQVDGVHDCTRACSDTSLLFASLETFYNCAALAAIVHYDEGQAYSISDETERNASSLMGNGSLAEFDSRPVLSSFISCAQEACAEDGLEEPCNDSLLSLSDGGSTPEQIFDAMEQFCPELSAEINPDIFGPGVLISYILQVCFGVMLYTLLKSFNIFVRYTQEPAQTKPGRRAMTLNRIETILWRDSSALSRTSIAIATTLVEFQEAQCWFVFAVQISSILAIVVNSEDSGAHWGELIMNAATAYHVSLNGVLCIFLIQVCLHKEGIRNWHTFLGFFVEYVLAAVVTSQSVSWEAAIELFRSQGSLEACGGNPSPRTYCATTNGADGYHITFFPHPIFYKIVFLTLNTITIVVLCVDQLAWTIRHHHRTQHIRIGKHRLGRWPDGPLKRYWVHFKTWLWRLLEVSYVVTSILYLVSLLQVVNGNSFASSRWTYGQIIAMTIWGPVIVKLFDLIISGPPKNDVPTLNAGPPRLRIDNVINRRYGTPTDSEAESRARTPSPSRRMLALNQPRRRAAASSSKKPIAPTWQLRGRGRSSEDIERPEVINEVTPKPTAANNEGHGDNTSSVDKNKP